MLDQTNTYDALKELQLFINTYPNSSRIPECNDLIDKLRTKLEYKDYQDSQNVLQDGRLHSIDKVLQ